LAGDTGAFPVEGGRELRRIVALVPLANVLALAHYRLALAGLHGDGRDLFLELAALLGRLCLVLREGGEFVLLLAGNLPLAGDVLRRVTPVVAVVGLPQAVLYHAVVELHPPPLLAPSQLGEMRREAHLFLAAGDHDLRIAGLDLLSPDGNGA